MKLSLLTFTLLMTCVSFNAHASRPSCNVKDEKQLEVRQREAIAVDKRFAPSSSYDNFTSEFYLGAATREELKNFPVIQEWIVEEINKESLLREQLVLTIHQNNHGRSMGNYEYYVDSNRVSCGRQIFKKNEVSLVSFQEVGDELTLKFQVRTSADYRWYSDISENQFDIKFAITKSEQFALQMTSYPQFMTTIETREDY